MPPYSMTATHWKNQVSGIAHHGSSMGDPPQKWMHLTPHWLWGVKKDMPMRQCALACLD
ncbi:MAG: hypothetical protein LBU32_27835 [Clostridiales bacterium]|nr:hypothetical protein [Clostridiales bacterium]